MKRLIYILPLMLLCACGTSTKSAMTSKVLLDAVDTTTPLSKKIFVGVRRMGYGLYLQDCRRFACIWSYGHNWVRRWVAHVRTILTLVGLRSSSIATNDKTAGILTRFFRLLRTKVNGSSLPGCAIIWWKISLNSIKTSALRYASNSMSPPRRDQCPSNWADDCFARRKRRRKYMCLRTHRNLIFWNIRTIKNWLNNIIWNAIIPNTRMSKTEHSGVGFSLRKTERTMIK